MSKTQKNQTTTISREELPNLIISTLSEAVDAWGDKEKLSALSSKMMDLGVAWENFKSNEEASHIMIFEGVGSGLSEEGKVFGSLSASIESGDQPAFSEAVTAIKEEISVKEDEETEEPEPKPEDDSEEEPKKEEPEVKPEEKPEEPADDAEKPKEEAPEQESEPVVEESVIAPAPEQAIEATNPETPAVEVATEKWGTDLAAELAEKKKSEAKAKAAKEELIQKEKAASFKPDPFSWDKVSGGKFQG